MPESAAQSFSKLSLNMQNVALPPDHTVETFSAAIEDFRKLLGAEHVELIETKSLKDQSYLDPPMTHDPFHIHDQDEFVGSAVVCPGSTEDVQNIMKICNKHRTPIWPVSIGRNFGYGGAAPRLRGSLIMNLGKRMDKIIEVDEDQAFTLVEPGVTYQKLYDDLQRRGSKLWIDVPDLGGGSVLGNASDRGVGYTPAGDHMMMHCGMEVVLPTGEVIRTGMGAMPDKEQPHGSSSTWQLFNYGFGPYHDGTFTQSNYGIITKIGMWLMPDPGGYQAYQITFDNDDDLYAAIEVIRPLRLAGILQNVPSIRSATLDLAVAGPRSKYSSTGKPLTDAEIKAAIDKAGFMGRWNFFGAIYGPDPVRAVLWDAVKAAFGTIPSAKFYEPKDVPDEEKRILHIRKETLAGIPSLTELSWTNFVDNGSTLFFSPICPVNGKEAKKEYGIVKKRFAEFGFDYLGTMTVGMRELHHIVIVMFNREDPEEKARALKLMRTLVDDCAAIGHGEYRTHLTLMDQIAGTYSWNDNALLKYSEKIKDAIDPNGVLGPGKSGIWPKNYRHFRNGPSLGN